MATELTKEQREQLNKLGVKFFFNSLFIGVYHAALLVLINFVSTLAILLLGLPEWTMYLAAFVAGVIIFKEMFSKNKASHDRLLLEVKKITDKN